MAGAGGNKIAVIPELDLAVVPSNTLFGQGGAHQQTEDDTERLHYSGGRKVKAQPAESSGKRLKTPFAEQRLPLPLLF